MPDRIQPADVLGIEPTAMTTTPTPRPVPTQEDRMAGARNDRTFATYLDRTERDQLDARAATAEQERDEALDDRDAYKEARDVLRKQLDAMKAAKKRALGRLEKAEHVIDLIRDGQEQIDRALAVYDTTPSEEPGQQDAEQPEDLRSPLAAERDKLVETIGRLVSLPPEQIAQMHKVGYSGTTPALGSLPPRAQDEPARSETDVPDWVLMLVRGLAKYDREHPRLYRYISSGDYRQTECPCPLLEGVPAAVRARAVEREG